jgi:UDP:flavonoid glycosyltransferase YjiC (YdhE family)
MTDLPDAATRGIGAHERKRLLVATWDGGGNLQPTLALVEACTRRGHEVFVIGHDVQKAKIEAAGATFVRYETAPQWDLGVPGWARGDPVGLFIAFGGTARDDLLAAAKRLEPDAILIDCMLPGALSAARRAGFKTVALVHTLYSFFADYMGGAFRGSIDKADLALAFSYEAFDRGATFPPNLVFVGPARAGAGAGAWVRRQPDRPFVVVSLGVVLQGDGHLDLLQRVCDALAQLEVEALVTTGRGIAPESVKVAANTTAERGVAHDTVLSGADLLVTHAGHSTVMAGLTCGVPMLCLAPLADQPLNAAKVAGLGLGEALSPAASTKQIAEAILRLLGDSALRARTRAFAAAAASQPGVEKAVELVEALAV